MSDVKIRQRGESDSEKAIEETYKESVDTSDNGDAYEIDPVAEARLVRKLDWTLLPMFTATYLLNFIDRTSIGNARVAGLEADLGMQGYDLNIALTIFYVFYSISDIPSNLLLKRFGSLWLAFLVIAFGAVSIGAAFVKSYAGLIVSRVFLGLAEGGALSAMVYILARYYRKRELVLRIGIFFGIGPSLAGAFGGLIASGLLRVRDFGIIRTWRKIFFIEGLITTVFGIALIWILPEDPTKTKMLNAAERKLALARLDAGQIIKTGGKKEKTTLKLVLQSFNLITCACTFCFILINMSFQGLGLFLPSVVRGLGNYSVVEVQLRTVPPYVVSMAWVLFTSWVSSRINIRSLPLFYSVALTVSGYAVSIATKDVRARYAACFLMLMGGAVAGPMLVNWGTDNSAPDTMKAVVTAAIPGIGAIGAIAAVWTYVPTDAPDYRNGNTTNLAACTTICVLVACTAFYIKWENAKRDRGERDHRLEGVLTPEQETQLGYKHPRFRYQL